MVMIVLILGTALIIPVTAESPPPWWPSDVPYITEEPTPTPMGGMAYREVYTQPTTQAEGMAYREVYTQPTTQAEGMAYREVYTQPTTQAEGMAYREVYTQPTTQAQGYIRVSSTPSGATAIVDEYQRLSTPDTFTVPADRYHTVQVQLYGYQPYSQSVLVKSGQTTTVSASLVKNAPVTGGLTVSSIPSGADIYIDGNYRGETASTIGGLSPGTHTLSLRKAGYHDASSTISITPGSVTSRSITLQKYQPKPAVGSIEVISDPPGALIFLDGNFQGTTHTGNPFDITGVAPGTHTVRLELADYQPVSKTVTVPDGGISPVVVIMTKNIPPVIPDTTGQAYISSSPAGADVYLDNAYKGITPLPLSDVPAGSHAVLLQMSGYTDWKGTTQVTAGQSVTLSGTLNEVPTTTTTTKAGTMEMGIVTGLLSVVAGLGIARWRKE